MELSRGLITRLVDEDRLNEVNRSGIDVDFLGDDESQTVFQYIQRHYSEYKKVPSRNAVKQAFPNFEFVNYKEPLEYFIDALKESYRRTVLEEALLSANRVYSDDTKAAERELRDVLSRLSVTSKSFRDVDLAQTAEERYSQYLERKANPGADGILSNWEGIDYRTLGWHPEEFIVLVGEKHKGKSWLMLWLAYHAMLQGERVLFVTKEMSQIAMASRFDSIFANVKFDSLRRGELSEQEEQRYSKRLGDFGAGSYTIMLARDGVNTIEDIEHKAIELDSTIVFADSVYLFAPDSRSGDARGSETARRMAISQRCKTVARSLGIPFIVSTQAGRKKSGKPVADLDNIEWSNAFAQDADVVLMLTKDDIDAELGRIWLHLLKCRDGELGSICVRTDFDYMTFEQDVTQPEPSTNIDIEDEEESAMWSQ